MFSSKSAAIFLKVRNVSAAGNGGRWGIAPGELYVSPSGEVPQAWQVFVGTGAIEIIADPGSGFDPIVINPRWFEDPPADKPIEEPVDIDGARRIVGLTADQFTLARSKYGLPKPCGFAGGPTAEAPDRKTEPRWEPAALRAWVADNPMLVAKASA